VKVGVSGKSQAWNLLESGFSAAHFRLSNLILIPAVGWIALRPQEICQGTSEIVAAHKKEF
jgi:hypothetical protein